MSAEKFDAILRDFNQAFDQLDAALVLVQAAEREVCPELFKERYHQEYILGETYDFSRQRKKAAQHVFAQLILKAEQQFAPSGARLNIEKFEVEEHFKLRDHDFMNFCPVSVWDYLVKEYGTQGEDLAYTQAADPIMKLFNIEPDQPIKTIGGQITLERRVWIDSFDKKFSNQNNLTYGCHTDIATLCNALSSFAVWSGNPILAADLKRFSSNLFHNKTITSRARYPLGSAKSPSITVITFTTRFEFRFSEETGLKLQEFLYLYASQLKAAA